MCMLTYIPEGVPATEELIEELYNGCTRNQDGFGWTIVSNDKKSLITFRSMDAIAALEAFQESRETNHGHALFHSRWGTHGEESIFNVHPFKVAKDPMTVMAHNGVLPVSTWPGKGDRRSDTHIFSTNHLKSWGMALDSKKFTDHVTKFIGSSNKLVFLSVNPRYQANVYIFGENLGTWSVATGVWHSNDGFRYPYSTPKTPAYSNSSIWGPDGSGWGDEYDEFPSIAAAYMANRGIDANRSSRDYTPGQMTPQWLPGRQVERASSVDDYVEYVKQDDGSWKPFKKSVQHVLTEQDVLEMHGRAARVTSGEVVTLDEQCQVCGSHEYNVDGLCCDDCGDIGLEVEDVTPCPNCGMFTGYDSSWRACNNCRMCGDCNLSMVDGSCRCFTPSHLQHRMQAGSRHGG